MQQGGGRRHRGRELALRVLFEAEEGQRQIDEILDYQSHDMRAASEVIEFAQELVTGVIHNMDSIDGALTAASEHWDLDDIGRVERALLRIATFEILYSDETPASVAIDEALEVAKVYAGPDSTPFVNGVLSHIVKDAHAV